MARVLIVDDERGMRTTLQEFLRDAHYEVGMAADAAQALAKLAAEDFDVVLTDIIMPRITGVKLLEAIREKSPNAQVLLMTGEPTVETASQAVRAGAFDYLTKPIGKEQLLKSVANAVKLKTLDDERQRLAKENQQYQENLERLVEERSAALHQSEERYRTLAESAQDLIYSIDRQWEVQYANRAAIAFLGENVIGQPLQELFPPEEFKRMKKNLQSVFVSGTPVSVVSAFSLPDREIWLDTQLVALSSGPAGTDSVMGISRDITARKQAQEALETANAELARTAEKAQELALIADAGNRAKSEFLANTSHELRTPLTGIIGLLQIVNGDLCDSPEEEHEFVQSALDSANHLLGIVNDVLDITNVEAGRLEINLERVRLADVLDEMQPAAGVQEAQKGLALNFNLPPDLYVQADPARLRQVLLNLVGNAIKFTETGEVAVSAQPGTDPNYALIEIMDTGVGIAPEFLPSAFDKFTQADESMSRKQGGTGLGLAITHGLVETMHGQVGLASEGVGHGTRAWLTLPLAGNN